MTEPSNYDAPQLDSWEIVLLRAAHDISLSESQYQLISDRYEVLQEIIEDATEPTLKDAHIFVQGSIRLKTTLKPSPSATNDLATVDADAVVWLPNAVGADPNEILKAIEDRFSEGAKVKAPIKRLRRGIRVIYADENPGFHIDVTPARCAPGNGSDKGEGNLQVPDRQTGWKASSPIPYARWLEETASQEVQISVTEELRKRHVFLAEASQDPLPDYEEYIDGNPLRAAVKLLKRHRDEWAIRHGTEDVRPISAVITTLAGKAYEEVAMESQHRDFRPVEAIMEIVARMPSHIVRNGEKCFVLNPQDPGENFAEKWNRPGDEGLSYRRAFQEWHSAALRDIRMGLEDFGSTVAFSEAMSARFGVKKLVVEETIGGLPGNWDLPGRATGMTANKARLSALVGGGASTDDCQADIKPVDRLG
jgi:hypothetical protein